MTKIKKILPTIFEDVKIFEMESFDDNRGSFKEIYNKKNDIFKLGKINIFFIN